MVLFLTAGSVWKSAGAESTKGCRAGYRLGLTADTYRRTPVGTITGEEGNVTCEKATGALDPLASADGKERAHVAKRTQMPVACCPGNASAARRAGWWTTASPATRIVARSALSLRVNCRFPLDCPAKWWNSSLQHSAIRISYRYICISGFVPRELLSLFKQRV